MIISRSDELVLDLIFCWELFGICCLLLLVLDFMVDTYVVMNVVLLILSYTKEKYAIIFTHSPAVSSIFIFIFWS